MYALLIASSAIIAGVVGIFVGRRITRHIEESVPLKSCWWGLWEHLSMGLACFVAALLGFGIPLLIASLPPFFASQGFIEFWSECGKMRDIAFMVGVPGVVLWIVLFLKIDYIIYGEDGWGRVFCP